MKILDSKNRYFDQYLDELLSKRRKVIQNNPISVSKIINEVGWIASPWGSSRHTHPPVQYRTDIPTWMDDDCNHCTLTKGTPSIAHLERDPGQP